MVRPTEPSQPPVGSRLSILPDDTENTVVITLEWLQETTKTPEGREEAFDLILAILTQESTTGFLR